MPDFIINSLAVVTGLALLVWSSDKFIGGAATLANHLKVSPLLIGLLILGFGTSAPEMMVSAVSAYAGNPELALGNAIGSNIANIALVLGVTAIVSNIHVKPSVLKQEFPILIATTIIVGILLLDYFLSFINGVALIIILILVLCWMIKSKSNKDTTIPETNENPPYTSLKASVLWTIIGLLSLVLSSKLLVWGAINIAVSLGISDLIIGLTIIAIGTSLPELAASVTAALKNEHEMAIGNIIGSNLFNSLAVIGISTVIKPYQISAIALERDFLIMAILTGFLFLSLIIGKKTLSRSNGVILSTIFVAYLVLLAQS